MYNIKDFELDCLNGDRLGNYSFTFTIPAFKNVYYKARRIPFGKLKHSEQYDFLENHLAKINMFDKIKWVYEHHEENDPGRRLHIHGFVKDALYDEMEEFRRRFYHTPVGIAFRKYIKISDIQLTIYDIKYFDDYMLKNQDKIAYFMKAEDDKKSFDAIEGKKYTPIKIESNIDPRYLIDLNKHIEDTYIDDEYKFGLNRNKFLVEI